MAYKQCETYLLLQVLLSAYHLTYGYQQFISHISGHVLYLSVEALILYFRTFLHRTVWYFVTSDNRMVTLRACENLSTEKIMRTVLLGYFAD